MQHSFKHLYLFIFYQRLYNSILLLSVWNPWQVFVLFWSCVWTWLLWTTFAEICRWLFYPQIKGYRYRCKLIIKLFLFCVASTCSDSPVQPSPCSAIVVRVWSQSCPCGITMIDTYIHFLLLCFENIVTFHLLHDIQKMNYHSLLKVPRKHNAWKSRGS